MFILFEESRIYFPAALHYYLGGNNLMNSKFLDYTLLTLVIVGAVNWGLIGFSALTS